jgi:beta-lactamase superfamily II metal-dependent hydrolase
LAFYDRIEGMTVSEPTTSLSRIRIAFLDVGQGDTIVVSSPETREAVVIDCIDADAVLEYL